MLMSSLDCERRADRKDQLAFVGLGEMGKRMAANLAKSLAQSGQVSFFLPSLPSYSHGVMVLCTAGLVREETSDRL
jgi:hypothetical protein